MPGCARPAARRQPLVSSPTHACRRAASPRCGANHSLGFWRTWVIGHPSRVMQAYLRRAQELQRGWEARTGLSAVTGLELRFQ